MVEPAPHFWRRRLTVPALAFALMALACLVGPALVPYGVNQTGTAAPFSAPDGAHWFGTDDLGRDLLVRVLSGGRISLGIAAGAASIALVFGTAWGSSRRRGAAGSTRCSCGWPTR